MAYRVRQIRPRLRSNAKIHRHLYRGETWHVLQELTTERFFRFTPSVYSVVGMMKSAVGADKIASVVGNLLSSAGGQRILKTVGDFASSAMNHRISSEIGTILPLLCRKLCSSSGWRASFR